LHRSVRRDGEERRLDQREAGRDVLDRVQCRPEAPERNGALE
jgi:hypothetical protein